MSELPQLYIIDESILAGASARQARNTTFVGVPLAGALLGTLLALAITISGAKPIAGFGVGQLRVDPTGYVLGMVLGILFSVITAFINSGIAALITWLIYSRDLSVRAHRWTLVFALPAIDMLVLALLWRPPPASGLRLTVFASAMLVTGVGAIIVGVLVSRWYAEEMALEARNFELIALGYNPEIAAR